MNDALTICYLGNFTRPWCTEVHVAYSLEQLGHRVVRLQENETDWPSIPARCDTEGAHMLLWTRTWPAELKPVVKVLAELERRGVHTVSYHLDRWFGLDREHQVDEQPFFRTALVVSPDDSPRWVDHGVNHLWMPPGVFGDELFDVPARPRVWPFDVAFVGSFPYPHAEWTEYRSGLVGAFTRAFGSRFTVLPRRGQPIRGRRLQELYATVPVILGDSCLAGESHRYWSDRIPETLGRGGLLIHPEVGTDIGPAGEWYRSIELGKDTLIPSIHAVPELLTYPLGDFDAAVFQARAALDHLDAMTPIRTRARETIAGRDTYRHRMADLLEQIPARLGPWREPPAPPPPPPTNHGRVQARCGPRWRAIFDPRPGEIDVAGGSFVVVDEVWTRNDYRVPPHGLKGTVLDIGANVGAFTVLAAKAGASKVVAVEPYPTNRERLEHHVRLNNVTGPVIVDPRAVVGTALDPTVLPLGGTGGGVHADGVLQEGDEPWVEAETVILADLIREHAPVRFLKVDIEGGEYGAFDRADMASILHDNVEELALEFHGPVMPHLAHLGEGQLAQWQSLVATLADCGRLEIMGHPTVGGLIWWRRY